MSIATTTRLSAIDFASDIDRLTEDFTGREWVFDEIDRWLRNQEERFLILTGEPGIGKSAIMARLTQIRDDVAAYHFCRANDVETVRPTRILRSIAAQLGKHLPDYGQALANTIKPIHLQMEVNINIGSMAGGEVTGVYIENLRESESDLENELDVLIRAPLEELQKMYAERQQTPPPLAIILIDSLDEAVTTTGTNLVKLLTRLSKSTSLPSWVRFVLTSRSEDRVLVEFEPLKPLRLEELSEQSLSDIRQYVEKRIESPKLYARLTEARVTSTVLSDEVTKLSSGNFLYTKLLLNDIEAERQSLADLSSLPKSIDEIYLNFLSRFNQGWETQHQPILGTLTVVQEPVTEDELSNLSGIKPRELRQNLRIVRQFLDVTENEEGESSYAIFHQSLRDYLLNKKRNKHFWCDAQEQHGLIVEYYEKKSNSWQQLTEIDRYGLLHLAKHLFASGRKEVLYKLLISSPAWMETKFINCVGDSAYVEDLELALSDFSDPVGRNQLLTLLQLHTARQSVHERTSSYNDTDLRTLVWLGREREALSHARLRLDAKSQFDSLLAIHNALLEKGCSNPTLLNRAWKIAELIEDDLTRILALNKLVIALAKDERFADAERVIQSIENISEQARALAEVAAALIQVEHFVDAEKVIQKMEQSIEDSPNRAMLLIELAAAVARNKHEAEAKQIFAKAENVAQTVEDVSKRAYILWNLTAALAQPEFKEEARRVLGAFKETAAGLIEEDLFKRIQALNLEAMVLSQIGCMEEANPILTEIAETSQSIEDIVQKAEVLRTLAELLTLVEREEDAAKDFAEAKRVTQLIEDETTREEALSNLAKGLMRTKRFAEAEASIRLIADTTKQAKQLEKLVTALVRADCFADAERVAKSIENEVGQAFALRELVITLAQANQFDEAKRIIPSMERDVALTSAWSHLAAALAQTGQTEKASIELAQSKQQASTEVGTTQSPKKNRLQVRASQVLAKALAQAEHFTEAVHIARTIENDEDREWVLSELSTAAAQAGQFIKAEEVARLIKAPLYQAEALVILIAVLAEIGQFSEAERIMQFPQIIGNYLHHSRALTAIAAGLAQAEKTEEANKVFMEAGKVARSTSGTYARTRTLSTLAGTLADTERVGEADAIFTEIKKVIQLNEDDENQMSSLNLATVLIKVKRFKEAEEVIESIKNPSGREHLQCELVAALTQIEDFEKAKEVAKTIEQNPLKTDVLGVVAAAYVRAGDLSSARGIPELVEDKWDRARILSALAVALAQARHFSEAEEIIGSIERSSEQAEALNALAAALAQAGQFVGAFDKLGLLNLDQFLLALADWIPAFERVEQGLSVAVLREVICIAGWVHRDWRVVYEALVTEN